MKSLADTGTVDARQSGARHFTSCLIVMVTLATLALTALTSASAAAAVGNLHAITGRSAAVTHTAPHSAKPGSPAVSARTSVPAPPVLPLGSRVALGAWVDGMDADPGRLDSFDQTAGRVTTIASVFRGYGEIFPSAADIALTNSGARSLLVAWYLDVDRFTGYTSGAHDSYLDQEAAAIRAYQGTVYIRPWAEMNADWVDFQPTASGSARFGGTPAQFISAWRHVVDRFRHDGATNVRWVFNPTADTYAETTDVATIWPGASYVDVLGLDGYNWGNGGHLTWRSFYDIFSTQYNRLTALHPSAPVWVCEFGSKEPSINDGAPIDATHSKAQWYADALSSRAFSRITALVAFQANKERNWQIGSSSDTPPAIRAGLQIQQPARGEAITINSRGPVMFRRTVLGRSRK
jgi:mannan endo-1,4-beta-mannosidase